MSVKAIPDGYYSLTPYLVCKGAAKAIEFYAKAFEAQETVRMPGPHGSIMHAEVKIGNSMLMLSDENKERGQLSPESIGGSACSIMLYADDVDQVFNRAVAAGAKAEMPPADMFWGDRRTVPAPSRESSCVRRASKKTLGAYSGRAVAA